ncbi:hypothetical protein QYE76_070340 [Lolium multiflorum]|uniref:Uncharacterized protein n=1 Tax=Lolium multiflorum TaxID=4521 RepID=A0AAD8WEC7_LOLMU|nr:hypothetical protein QYE76_070340 [Lolium multiflorum]
MAPPAPGPRRHTPPTGGGHCGTTAQGLGPRHLRHDVRTSAAELARKAQIWPASPTTPGAARRHPPASTCGRSQPRPRTPPCRRRCIPAAGSIRELAAAERKRGPAAAARVGFAGESTATAGEEAEEEVAAGVAARVAQGRSDMGAVLSAFSSQQKVIHALYRARGFARQPTVRHFLMAAGRPARKARRRPSRMWSA